MRYHRPRVGFVSAACCCWTGVGGGSAYIVEDVQIIVQGVAAGHRGAIVGDLDSVVESVQVDPVDGKRHGGGLPVGSRC